MGQSAHKEECMRRRVHVTALEEHPNLTEILGVLAQLPHIADADLPKLAAAWHNTVSVADARSKALGPDAPLVLEVLAAFEAVQSLFADDVAGEEPWLTVEPAVATTALKAIRDAIAAAYARPILSRGEHQLLMRAWRVVYPTQTVDEPDLGPNADQVKAVLTALPMLASRCHDQTAADLFEHLAQAALSMDGGLREAARSEAWRAAVLTSRRRIWGLVRRSGAEGLARRCTRCSRRQPALEERHVLELCLDAACALLVADTIDETLVEVLTLPLTAFIPLPRSAE
jgi:hypothetical protein